MKKVTFQTINKNNYKIIDCDRVKKTNDRIKKEMKPINRNFKLNQIKSWLNSKNKIVI